MNNSSNTLLVILAFFSIYFIWGSTYLLNKIAVTELPPFMLASVRFITAGLLIFLISLMLLLIVFPFSYYQKTIDQYYYCRIPISRLWKRSGGLGT